jgi:Ca-activated chloride channel family protein
MALAIDGNETLGKQSYLDRTSIYGSKKMNEIIQNFQFIRPQWLWLFLPIIAGYILKLKYGKDQNLWQQIIPKHLYQQMIVSKGIYRSNGFTHVSAFTLLIATLAIAGPSWEKLPQAVYQTQVGKVILMDMSMSLRATDLSPNRLTRARFKAIDLVNEVKEGETGLVAYSGDAFVVSPLTDDINNLKTLIPVLSPEIMPTQGSSALTGLQQSASLLRNAGYKQGQIYWITDGINYDEIKDVRNFIIDSDFDVSALLIGTEAGAPISMLDGQLLKDYSGKIVIPSIDSRYMNQAMAGTSAQYHLFAADNSDIQAIKMKVEYEQQQEAKAIENTTGDELKDMGPFLVLLLLPIAAYTFRKGLLNIAVVALFTSALLLPSQPTMAQTQAGSPESTPEITLANPNTAPETIVDKVFKNADQRGKLAFDNSDYDAASELFEDTQWRAASAYKKGDYESAARLYNELLKNKGTSNTNNLYNQGNTLAKLGKLEEAIKLYEQTLMVDGDHQQALQNKKIVEEMLKQQQNDPNQQQDSNDQNSDENGQQQDSEQQGDSDSQEQEQSQDGESQENGQQGDQNGEQQSQGQQTPEQQKEQKSEQQTNASDEALKQNAEEQAQEESDASPTDEQQDQESPASNKPNEQTGEQGTTEQEQQAAISNQIDAENLTPEQKEEMQRMQMILNKVPDDPAYLLKRKMQLEAYKRKNNPPTPEQENW